MLNAFSKTQLILGRPAMEKLYSSSVAVFGIAGRRQSGLQIILAVLKNVLDRSEY